MSTTGKFDIKDLQLPTSGLYDAKAGVSGKGNAKIELSVETPAGLVMITFLPGFEKKKKAEKEVPAIAMSFIKKS
jgi:hypothetical protein